MKKILITLSVSLIILSGFIVTFPATNMMSTLDSMGGMDTECIGHCLKTMPLNMQNSVPTPLVVQILGIFIAVVLSIVLIYRFNWSEEKIFKLHQLFLFNTEILRE